MQKTVADIQEILQPRYRRYLKVFHLEDKASLTNTVFRAVFDSIDEGDRRSSKCLETNYRAHVANCTNFRHIGIIEISRPLGLFG